MADHDRALAEAFDGQAERFERAPVQSDQAALARLVAFADLPEGSRVFDAGCGPGLVAEAFLGAGHRVVGIDLSAEMIARARKRCERFGDRARFEQGSLFGDVKGGPFDACVSRLVLHHVTDPPAFVMRLRALIETGGRLVVWDHVTDPDPARAAAHEQMERDRDRTHTRNLTSGGLVDLLAAAGLVRIEMIEEEFTLDFDEWFDRGTPAAPKSVVRERLLDGPAIRGFRSTVRDDGSIRIDCVFALVKGVVPGR